MFADDMSSVRLTAGLEYERLGRMSLVSAGVSTILRLRQGEGRCHVDLVLLNGSRTIEVSSQPAAPVDLLCDHARRNGKDPNGWAGALSTAVVEDARRWGARASARGGSAQGDLVRLLGQMCHPMLLAVYEAGAAPLGQVPRWAAPAFAEDTVAGCARKLFGVGPSTRSVVRALATLLGRPEVPWWALAVTVAAATVVEPDNLAQALATQIDEAAELALPSQEDVRVAQAGLRLVGATRARRLLRDAVNDEGGARRLVAVLRLLGDVERDLQWPPPGRLADLERVCLRVAPLDPSGPRPVDPGPSPTTCLVPEAPSAAHPPATRPPPAWTTPLAAPTVAGHLPGPYAELPPGPVAQALCRLPVTSDIQLVLPRTPRELSTWGRLLENCLADFAPAVAAGTTAIVGVRQRGALVAALELRDGCIAQFLGPRNRPPPARLSEVVVHHVERQLRGGR